MSATYLTYEGASRTETDATVIATLVRKGWVVTEPPVEPEPTAPTYTAEGFLDSQGFGGNRPTTLLYFKMQLQALSKTCARLDEVQQWVDSLIALGAQDLDALHSNLPPAPYSFAEVIQDALATLQNG